MNIKAELNFLKMLDSNISDTTKYSDKIAKIKEELEDVKNKICDDIIYACNKTNYEYSRKHKAFNFYFYIHNMSRTYYSNDEIVFYIYREGAIKNRIVYDEKRFYAKIDNIEDHAKMIVHLFFDDYFLLKE